LLTASLAMLVNLCLICEVGFISIRRYRDIDRGIGDLVIIAAPRDHTISYTCHMYTARQAQTEFTATFTR